MKQVAIISPLEDSFPLDLSSYKFLSPRYGSVVIASYLTHHGYRAKVFCEHSHNPIDWDYVRTSDYITFVHEDMAEESQAAETVSPRPNLHPLYRSGIQR